ncbi:MAG TPA: EVE domain-containing protein [Pseudolabrys sp.]|nr:EVE domain-containing protein [Pseudolabrys sp.]
MAELKVLTKSSWRQSLKRRTFNLCSIPHDVCEHCRIEDMQLRRMAISFEDGSALPLMDFKITSGREMYIPRKISKQILAYKAKHPSSFYDVKISGKLLAKIQSDAQNNRGFRTQSDRCWVLVCNPKKWAIDRFFEAGIEFDTWGIRPFDREHFAPGQFAIVRVGVDRRSERAREGRPKLAPGIYALCEIISEAFPGTGANDLFWARGAGRKPGWPTVNIRYLNSYQDRPLTIKKLTAKRPKTSPQLLKGFQASSFPISKQDFEAVLVLLKENLHDLSDMEVPVVPNTADQVADLEKKFRTASPKRKERVSRTIERGPVGAIVKRFNKFKCQVCEALGLSPIGFLKRTGDPYVEAHHVMPVSKGQIGSLAASNILTVCANHHREMHYGNVAVKINKSKFVLKFPARRIEISRCNLASVVSAPGA